MPDTVLDRPAAAIHVAPGSRLRSHAPLVPVVDPDGPVVARLLGAARHPDHLLLSTFAIASVFLGPLVLVIAIIIGGWVAVVAALCTVGAAVAVIRASHGVIHLDLVAPNLRADDRAALAEMQDLRTRLADSLAPADRHVVADVDRLLWAAAHQARRGVTGHAVSSHLATIRDVACASTRSTPTPGVAATRRLEHYIDRQHALTEAHQELE